MADVRFEIRESGTDDPAQGYASIDKVWTVVRRATGETIATFTGSYHEYPPDARVVEIGAQWVELEDDAFIVVTGFDGKIQRIKLPAV